MHEDVDDVIARRRVDPAGLNRALSASMAIHFGTVLLLLVIPKNFWAREQPKTTPMTISLSGSGGDRSGGMVAAGARPVEQVAPPPKRSEPIPPATPPKAASVNLSAKAPAKAPPVPSSTPSPATRPPTTGAQTRPGTAAAETGAVSQTTGLTFGGKTAGDASVNLDTTFCCPDYIEEMRRRIVVNWPKDQPVTGSVTVVFEILKDGTFTAPQIERSTDRILDFASLKPFQLLRLDRLPKEYPGERLKIHLTFPYVR